MVVTPSNTDLGPFTHVAYSILASDVELWSLSYVPSGVHTTIRNHSLEQTLKSCIHDSPALSAKMGMCMLAGNLSDSTQHLLNSCWSTTVLSSSMLC